MLHTKIKIIPYIIIVSILFFYGINGYADYGAFNGMADEITIEATYIIPTEEEKKTTASITYIPITTQSSITEALHGVEGVYINSINDSTGQMAFARIRGTRLGQTQVLIDGVPMSDPSYPQQYASLSMIPISMVDYIEIIRGAEALQYGSGTLGGVINIHTKKGIGKYRPSIATSIASYKTVDVDAGLEGANDKGYINIHGGYTQSQGFVLAEEAVDPNGYQSPYIMAVGEWNQNNWTIRASAQARKSIIEVNTWDVINNRLGADLYDNTNGLVQAYISTTYKGKIADTTVLYKEYQSSTEHDDPSWFSRYRGVSHKMQLTIQEKKWNTGTLIMEGQINSMKDESKPEPYSQNSMGIALIEQGEVKGIIGQAGLRIDGIEGVAGITPTYHVGLEKQWRPILLRANYGTSFRAPSLYEQNDHFFGNKNLKPEYGHSVDMGIVTRAYDISLLLTGFYTHNNESIYFENGRYENTGTYTSHGLESAVQYAITQALDIKANYTFTQIHSPPAGISTTPYPKHMANMNLDYRWKITHTTLKLEYVGKRLTSTGNILDPYTLVSLDTILVTPKKDWKITAGIHNIFNKDYTISEGYETSKRTWRIGLQWH